MVWGLGFRVCGLGFRVWGLGFGGGVALVPEGIKERQELPASFWHLCQRC